LTAYLRSDGLVTRTEPEDDRGKYRDVDVETIVGFDHRNSEFVDLEIKIDDGGLDYRAGSVRGEVLTGDMPYIYPSGKVRVSTSKCRVVIQEIELKRISTAGS